MNVTWYEACNTDACPQGTGVEVVVADQIIALFHMLDGSWQALHGICPHHGGPLGKGELNDCVVTCPWHGWQFDVRDGSYQHSQQLRHPTFPTRVDGDTVWVGLETNE